MAVGDVSGGKNAHGDALLLAQEIEFAKVLAGNDKKLRDRGIKKLRRWLIARSRGKFEFTDDDFLRIWKGLYYCMWMADKLLVQEELAEKISDLVHCFKKSHIATSFIRCFFQTMVLEWYGIDLFRYDKFMMLVRRFLRQTFILCNNCNWQEETVTGICNAFSATVLSSPKEGIKLPPFSLVTHFCDIYLQELAKVGKEKIPVEIVTVFLLPFIRNLAQQTNDAARIKIMQNIFINLINQSDTAIECIGKWKAWKAAGFPGESWKDMERVDDEEEMVEEDDGDDIFDPSEKEMLRDNPLDPRAGHVDVELPQILFDSHSIAQAIEKEYENCSNKKCKKTLQVLEKQFIELAEGNYIFENSEDYEKMNVPKINKFKMKKYVVKAAYRLRDFEQSKGKNRRRRKNKNAKKSTAQYSTNEITKDNEVEETTIGVTEDHAEKTKNSTSESKVDSMVDTVKENQNTNQSSPNRESIRSSTDGKKNTRKIILPSITETKLSFSRKRKSCGSSLEEFVVEPKFKVLKKDTSERIEKKCKMSKETKRNSSCIDSDGSASVKKKKSVSNWEVSDMVTDSFANDKVKTPAESLAENSKLNIKSTVDKKLNDVQDSNKKSNTPLTVGKKIVTPPSTKKVNIALHKNGTQNLWDYHLSVKSSPSIPFDAEKQPSQGVLKPSPIGSRINPFYRLRNRKLLGS